MNESTFSKVSERRVLKLRAACSRIYSGGTPDTSIKEYWTGNFPWLSSGETNNRFIKNTKNFISESGVKNSSTKLAKRGSSVIASAGQGHTRGQVSYLMIDTYINQSVIALFPDETILDSLFLFYSLNLKYERFRQISDDHSIRGSLTTKILGDEEISLPPLTDQKVIAKILSDLDEKIELNNQMNKTLEDIAQAIFKRWLIDFEFPNENGEPYKSSGGEMVESELGMIPKDWGVSTIGKSLQTFLGGTPSTKNKNYWTSGSIPWINSGKVNEFRILEPTAYITEEALKNSATKIMPKKTTVIAITGATLGKVSIIEKEMCANQSVVGIIENKILPSEFIYFWVKAHMKKLMSEQTGGAQQHINKENVNSLEILIPPLQIIEKYIINVRPIFDEISNKCSENLTLSKIRDDLLPKLMTGKIRVPLEEQNV
jgi:type I restriction enzyme S subunit